MLRIMEKKKRETQNHLHAIMEAGTDDFAFVL